MCKWVATVVLALAIVLAAALVVGEMRYRDCMHERDTLARTGWGNGTPDYSSCSHLPF